MREVYLKSLGDDVYITVKTVNTINPTIRTVLNQKEVLDLISNMQKDGRVTIE